MRASELPSPADLKRRLSPLPWTLAALACLLTIELAGFAPLTTRADIAAVTTSLAEVAPAAASPAPDAAESASRKRGGAGSTSTAVPAAAAQRDVPARNAVPTTVADAAGTTSLDVIDALLAPAAGRSTVPPLAVDPGDPLAAEPFLAERRALARQREALSVRQLAVDVAEERLRELLEELGALKAEIDARLAELEAGDEARRARLVALYEKMRAKDAARIFDELDFEVLVPLALTMNERKLAPIVAAMTPEVARRLTREVAKERADRSLAAALEPATR